MKNPHSSSILNYYQTCPKIFWDGDWEIGIIMEKGMDAQSFK